MYNLKKDGKEILSINKGNIMTVTSNDIFGLKKSEFEEFLRDSFLESSTITSVLAENSEMKNALLALGFNFEGIEYNPQYETIEEIFSYKIKEELLMKDEVLKDILEKLDISI